MLGPQDGQRPGGDAKAASGKSQGWFAGYLASRDTIVYTSGDDVITGHGMINYGGKVLPR